MCITIKEVSDVVDKRLQINNETRDNNLNNVIFKFKEEIFVHIQKVVSEIPPHRTSPETKSELTNIKNNCTSRGTEIALMNQTLREVVDKQSKQDEKLDKILEKLDKKYAPMAAWLVIKWVGAVIGAALLLLAIKRLFEI